MATRLPYYTGTDDIYSQLMAQYAQEQPYYSATPYNAGGYDTTLYYRPPVVQIGGGGNYSGLLGGGFSGGPDAISSPNAFANPNSITNGLIAAVFGQDPTMVPVDSLGGNLANLNPINEALNTGLLGQVSMMAPPADPSMDSSGLSPADNADPSMESAGLSPAEQAETDNDVAGIIGGGDPGDVGGDTGPGADPSMDSAGLSPEGGGGGGGGGKIICTKLHELGKMPTEIYEADQAFGALLVKENPETYYGYVRWAQHVVRWMSRDDLFGKFVVFAAYTIATPWSIAMAEEMGLKVKSNCFGRFLLKRGLQFCQMIGKNQDQRSIQNV